MELLIGLALLVAAIFAARLAVRSFMRRGEEPQAATLPRLQAQLPNIGTSGSATSEQVARLRKSALPSLDRAVLSDRQATLLIDCLHYVETIWGRDFDRRPGDLSAEVLEAAVGEILTHPSYCERVVTWDEGYYEAGEEVVPDDACHTAVMHVLKGASV